MDNWIMNEWRNIYLCFVPFVCPFVVLAPCERAAHFSSSTENSFLFERKQHPEEQYAIIWTGWKVNTDVGSRGHASEHELFHHVQHTHTHPHTHTPTQRDKSHLKMSLSSKAIISVHCWRHRSFLFRFLITGINLNKSYDKISKQIFHKCWISLDYGV